MKVLISAYACEPLKGSEPGVGWAWAREMSSCTDLSVMTRANNRKSIEECGESWVRNIHWIYFDLPVWARLWKRGSRGANLYYWLWQCAAFFFIKNIHRAEKFDVIHHATFGRYWVPSWLGLLDAGFVFGPVGGGEDTPPGLTPAGKGKISDLLRSTVRKLSKFDPILRATLHRKRSVAVAATDETRRRLVWDMRPLRTELVPQCALDDTMLAKFGSLPAPQPGRVRIISIGRLVPWKGYHLGLRAFARVVGRFPNASYWLVNDGPEQERLESLAEKLGIAGNVTFFGKLRSLDEVYAKLGAADILLHPALHEAFGNVCLEAMAAGRPVVCLSGGGPGLQITRTVGSAVKTGSEQETVESLADAIIRIGGDPELLASMSEAAKKRAAKFFSWKKNASQMLGIYRSVLLSA
jgi:glycosyltransferase involved in cell wall biosynthesis